MARMSLPSLWLGAGSRRSNSWERWELILSRWGGSRDLSCQRWVMRFTGLELGKCVLNHRGTEDKRFLCDSQTQFSLCASVSLWFSPVNRWLRPVDQRVITKKNIY